MSDSGPGESQNNELRKLHQVSHLSIPRPSAPRDYSGWSRVLYHSFQEKVKYFPLSYYSYVPLLFTFQICTILLSSQEINVDGIIIIPSL